MSWLSLMEITLFARDARILYELSNATLVGRNSAPTELFHQITFWIEKKTFFKNDLCTHQKLDKWHSSRN